MPDPAHYRGPFYASSDGLHYQQLDGSVSPAIVPGTVVAVASVNGQTGAVTLNAASVGAATVAQVSALVTGAINPASIGATTPGTGAYTTLSASGTVTAASFAGAGVGVAPGTVAAGNDSRLAVVTLEQYGALPADCGALCQTIANTLGAANGGIIQLRERTYNFATKVSLPTGVHLRGANDGPKRRGDASVQTVPEGITNGTVLAFTYASGDTATATAGITLQPGSSLRDVSLYEPNQANSGTSPAAYCFAVRINGFGCHVTNVELINNYRGIDVQGGRNQIVNVFGNPLNTGINVDNAGDYTEIYCVYFGPLWTTPGPGQYVLNNAIALSLGRCDDIRVRDVRTFNYGTTLNLFVGAGGYGAYGTIDGLSSDSSITCITNNGTGSRELLISGARLIANTTCYVSNSSSVAPVRFVDGYFTSSSGTSALMTVAAGALVVRNSTFVNVPTQVCLAVAAGHVGVFGNGVSNDFSGVFAFDSGGTHALCWSNYSLINAVTNLAGGPVTGAVATNGADARLSERAVGQLSKSGSQTITASPTTVAWDTADFVTTGIGLPASGPIAGTAGYYRVTGSVALSVPSGSLVAVYLTVNGANVDTLDYLTPTPGSGTTVLVARGSSVLHLAANAAVGLQVTGPTSGSIIGYSTPQTSITLEQL